MLSIQHNLKSYLQPLIQKWIFFVNRSTETCSVGGVEISGGGPLFRPLTPPVTELVAHPCGN